MATKFQLTHAGDNGNQNFRFGLLLNSPVVEAWQAKTIELLLENGQELVLVVMNGNPATQKPSFAHKFREYPFHQVLFRVWNRFFFKPDSKKSQDISSSIISATTLKCVTYKKGLAQYFDQQSLEEIKSHQLDFLLRFGFNIIRGEILQAARFGVWSFHHDDEQEIRGGPPGFWEFFYKKPSNGVILQQLTDALDKGIILKKVWFPVVYHCYASHLDQLYFESSLLPLQVCRQMIKDQLFGCLSHSKAKIFHPPGNAVMMRFLLLGLWRRLSFHFNFLFRQEDWNIGLIHNTFNHDRTLSSEPEKIQWLKRNEKYVYLADPFVIDYENDTLLFAERFDYKQGKGNLVVLKQSEDFQQQHHLLDNRLHFSFPFVFKIDTTLYCIPECYQSNSIQLYTFDSQNTRLVFKQNLLEGFQAVDPILFEYEQRWWMFFTTKTLPSVHLYAFYSDQPFGDFMPHANNPIKTDIRSARNAGMPFVKNGDLYRPTQDCSLHYGRAVNLCQVVDLSPTTFEEKIVNRYENDGLSEYSNGLHTLNFVSKMIAIDGKRFITTLYGFRHQLNQRLKLR